MDLSLNLSPPSPPPNLGLSLGLSSTPSAAEEEEENEEEEEAEEEEEEEERSFLPDLIWSRDQPLCPSYTDPYLTTTTTTRRGGLRGGSEEEGSYPGVRCRLRRLTSILEESGASAMARRTAFSPPPSPLPLCHGFLTPKETSVDEKEKEAATQHANANFECNICLELASEPVVTMCGHLFCWPCLYQWLHLYSTCKECPVCKGAVSEKNVIPIYGRGVNPNPSPSPSPNFSMAMEEEEEALPPRPRARRVESWRQRERDRERNGVASLSRRVEEIIRYRHNRRMLLPRYSSTPNQNENRPYGSTDSSSPDHLMTRLRTARNNQRRESASSLGQRLGGLRDRLRRFRSRSPDPDPSLASRAPAEEEEEGEVVFGDLAIDRMAAIRARLASMEGMLETFAGLNPPINANPDLAASASSPPVLVIPAPMNTWADDARLSASVSASGALIDPGVVSEAESSSLLFSRRRDAQTASGGGASGSSDVEGSFFRRRKIQRL